MSSDKLRKKAEKEIKNRTQLAYDVALSHGQHFYNVWHTLWFVNAIVEELEEHENKGEI